VPYPYGEVTADDFRGFALALAPPAAAVANYCDHTEHNEVANTEWVIGAAGELQRLVIDFAAKAGVDLIELYAERLGRIEERNVLARPGRYDGHGAALDAETWRGLQVVQAEHDRYYHGDVVGLAKAEQLRHYALHLSKIVGAFAEARDAEDLVNRRLPDTLLFSLKLHTVMGNRLPDERVPRGVVRRSAVTASS
jgi:hypothetical protein